MNQVSIQTKIEERVFVQLLNYRHPTKVYLGKKEHKALMKELTVTSRNPKTHKVTKETPKAIFQINFEDFALKIVKTKHKSYFRMVCA